MDDRRFDALTRALGTGQSRRQMLRGLLGIGGGAVAMATVLPVDAARRGSKPPRAITCPGQQIPSGDVCICPSDMNKCGPDCCEPDISQCCDNACCYGTCFGEELCCPSPNIVCNGQCVSGVCCTDDECRGFNVCTENYTCCIPAGNPTSGITGVMCTNDVCCSGECDPERLVCL